MSVFEKSVSERNTGVILGRGEPRSNGHAMHRGWFRIRLPLLKAKFNLCRIRKAVKELLTFTIIQGQNRVKEEHESSFQTEEGSTRPIFGIEKANEEVNEKTNATAPVPLSSYNIVKTGRKPRVRYTLSPLNDTAYEDDTEYEDDPGLLRCSNVAGSVPSGPFKRRSSTSYRLNALKRLHSSRRTTAPLQSALLRSIETPIRQVNTKSPATSISQINTKSRATSISQIDTKSPATSISQIDTKSPALSNYGLLTPPSFNNKPRVTFHFFLSDPNLGAITIPISECDTCTSFFNYAATAQALCGSKSHETTPGALSVNTGEFDWPIVVPWKDQRSFRKMIEFVRKAEDRSSEDLNIKVNYIKNG